MRFTTAYILLAFLGAVAAINPAAPSAPAVTSISLAGSMLRHKSVDATDPSNLDAVSARIPEVDGPKNAESFIPGGHDEGEIPEEVIEGIRDPGLEPDEEERVVLEKRRRNPMSSYGKDTKAVIASLAPEHAMSVIEKMLRKYGFDRVEVDALLDLIESVHQTRELINAVTPDNDDVPRQPAEPHGGIDSFVLTHVERVVPSRSAVEVIGMMLPKLKLEDLEVDALLEIIEKAKRTRDLVEGVTTGQLGELGPGGRKGGSLSSIPPESREQVEKQRLEEYTEQARIRSSLGVPYATSLLATATSTTPAPTPTGAPAVPKSGGRKSKIRIARED